MKNTFKGIIAIFILFSTLSVQANETGILEDLLDLNYGPMEYELSLDNLDTYNFKNYSVKKTYTFMVKYDHLIRNEIVNQYEAWVYSTATANGIVKNYKSFIYYTNKLFYFLSLVDKNPSLKDDFEVQNGILKNYKLAASYYKKTKNLIQDKEY